MGFNGAIFGPKTKNVGKWCTLDDNSVICVKILYIDPKNTTVFNIMPIGLKKPPKTLAKN